MAIETKEGTIPERYEVESVDNRDQRTTWLWIGKDYVEINPIDLMDNMIENCYNEDMSFLFLQFQRFLEITDAMSEDVKGERENYIESFSGFLRDLD